MCVQVHMMPVCVCYMCTQACVRMHWHICGVQRATWESLFSTYIFPGTGFRLLSFHGRCPTPRAILPGQQKCSSSLLPRYCGFNKVYG